MVRSPGPRLISRLMRRNWLLIGALIVLTVLASVGQVGIGYLLQQTVNAVAQGQRSAFTGDALRFGALALALPLIGFVDGQIRSIGSQGIARKLREEVTQALLHSGDLSSQMRLKSGEVVSRLVGDCGQVASAPVHLLGEIASTLITALLAFIYIIHFSPILALIAVSISPMPLLWSALWVRRVATAERAHRAAVDRENTAIGDAHAGLAEYKTQGFEPAVHRLLADRFTAHYRTSRRFDRLTGYNGTGNELLSFITLIGTYVLAGYFVLHGQISIGFMLAYLQLMQHVQRPFQAASHIMRRVASSLVSASRVNDILSLPQETSAGAPPPATWQSLSLENLSFAYREGTDPLTYPRLDIHVGERVGLVGANGSGKSTMLRLVLRLLTPHSGSVSVNGTDATTYDLSAYRKAFAVAPQEPHFIEDSVRANLDPEATFSDDQLWDALDKAGLRDALRSQGGLDLMLSPGGTNLSRGQRQRLALARVFLRPEARVLVLDEPFASMDEGDRDQILSALDDMLQDRIGIIVSHRSEDLVLAQRTVRLG